YSIATNLPYLFFAIHRLEVFLLGFVRTESKIHMPVDPRDSIVSHLDLIAGIDDGSKADSRSVGQIPSRYIGSEADGGVVTADHVAIQRLVPDGGVVVASTVHSEGIESGGGVAAPREVTNEGIESGGGVGAASSVLRKCLDSAGGVEAARIVASKRIAADSGVVVAFVHSEGI